jgi:YD repeat-containing protein
VGEVIGSEDAEGNTTTFLHDDKFYNDNGSNPPSGPISPATTDAYLTTVTLPSPFGWHLHFGYYYGSGKLAWSEDANAHFTYYHTNWAGQDPWDRTIETQLPIGWRLTDYTSATQVDSYLGITDTSASTSCTSCRHDQALLDDWGRVITKSLVSDPEGTDNTNYSYDNESRLLETWQNVRYGDGAPTEAYSYDALDRTLSDLHADSSSLTTYYGTSVTAAGGISPQLCTIGNNGTGYPILGVDEAGHKREVWIDGLGNTIEVDEPDASSGSLSHATCYSYDALGNLLSVTQGSQSRTYIYDYLSRVVSATTPETKSIAVTYSYMNGPAVCSPNPSSVCSKTDGMGVTDLPPGSAGWIIRHWHSVREVLPLA